MNLLALILAAAGAASAQLATPPKDPMAPAQLDAETIHRVTDHLFTYGAESVDYENQPARCLSNDDDPQSGGKTAFACLEVREVKTPPPAPDQFNQRVDSNTLQTIDLEWDLLGLRMVDQSSAEAETGWLRVEQWRYKISPVGSLLEVQHVVFMRAQSPLTTVRNGTVELQSPSDPAVLERWNALAKTVLKIVPRLKI